MGLKEKLLVAKDEVELSEIIHRRLMGADLGEPYDRSMGEEPENRLIEIYSQLTERSDGEKFRGAVRKLLHDHFDDVVQFFRCQVDGEYARSLQPELATERKAGTYVLANKLLYASRLWLLNHQTAMI